MIEKTKIYKIICPYCDKIQYAQKSIAQECGLNTGRGICLYCYGFMELNYDDINDSMIAEEWREKEGIT